MSKIDDLELELKYYRVYGDSRHRYKVDSSTQEINMWKSLGAVSNRHVNLVPINLDRSWIDRLFRRHR